MLIIDDGETRSSAPAQDAAPAVSEERGGPPASTAAGSILVPAYRDDPCGLVEALAGCIGAARWQLVIHDDGTGDGALTRRLRDAIHLWPGPSLLRTDPVNRGRSHARNALRAAAAADWLLYFDADMRPDSAMFLSRYGDAASGLGGPGVLVGGFSLQQADITAQTRLHAVQAERSECLSAAQRREAPGRYVFSSNLLVHRAVLEAVSFDEGFSGWGWEDVDWGLRAAERFPVEHIDNTATHLGLESAVALLAKYTGSGGNYARARARHPDAIAAAPLDRAVRLLAAGPPGLRGGVAAVARLLALSPAPVRARLFGLKAARAAAYARTLKEQS